MSQRVIRVFNDVASIASSDETFFNVPVKELDFAPQKGDIVQCFKNGEQIIIVKQAEGFLPQIVKGSMTDPRDGKVYETVEIGSHIWLAENLSYKTSDSLCYDNDEENAKKYGRLYKFGDAKNACPPGWHLPSSNEIESLVHAVGGMSIAGKSLKSVSGWQSEEGQSKKNLDSVGFSALPAGFFLPDDDPEENPFGCIGKESIIWFDSGSIYLYHDSDCVDIDFDDNECDDSFCSVRCVKDETYYKIIRVVNGVASVASNSGDVFNISVNELDFEPKTGDEVLCFKNGEQLLVVAKNFVPAKTGTNDQSQDNPKDAFKIIRVLNGVASVASSSGDVLNVPVDELDFEPKVGDDVQCFRNGEDVIVLKDVATPCNQKQTPNTISKNESPSNLQASAEISTDSKTNLQGIEKNTPIENPFAEELAEKKSKLPWIIGIIILLLGILFICIQLNKDNSSVSKEAMTDSHDETAYKSIVKGTMIDSRDGKTYKTVKIGSQIWMAENLNYKTKRGSWCYDDNESNCARYGRLYTWAAAMDSIGTWSTNGKGCGDGSICNPKTPVRGVCPGGWHLPSKTEWEILFTTVGGKLTAGSKLKSMSGWPRGNGTDDFGFSALPAGARSKIGIPLDRSLLDGPNATHFWSSTKDGLYSAYAMYLRYQEYTNEDGASLISPDRCIAFSVRCIQN